jgi:hypothetical protein
VTTVSKEGQQIWVFELEHSDSFFDIDHETDIGTDLDLDLDLDLDIVSC